MYKEELLKEFYEPSNIGVIRGASGKGKVVSKANGEIVKIYILVNDKKITEATFEVFGCPATIACASVATKFLTNKTIDEAKAISEKDILSQIGGALPENKKSSVYMVIEAALKAIAVANGESDNSAED